MGKMGRKVKSKVERISNIPTSELGFVQSSQVNKVEEEIYQYIPESYEKVIKHGEVGRSYKRLFGPFLDSSVTKIILEDPYLQKKHQIINLNVFLSLCTEQCPNLKKIQIVTKLYDIDEFANLKELYKKHLTWRKNEKLHDRHIWLLKSKTKVKISLGRGLDIYQQDEYDRFEQTSDQDEMKCMETTIRVTEYPLDKPNNMPKRKTSSVITTGEKAQAA